MKNSRLLLAALIGFVFISCVQKSAIKTVVVKLNIGDLKKVQTIGIRGSEKPLSWDYDMELKSTNNDSIYTTTFSILTGYKFTEVKFTMNGQFELNDLDNRKIIFSDKDTTVYEAKFNVQK